MKRNKRMFCDWCEYRDFEPIDYAKDKPEDTCTPPDGKCPYKSKVK